MSILELNKITAHIKESLLEAIEEKLHPSDLLKIALADGFIHTLLDSEYQEQDPCPKVMKRAYAKYGKDTVVAGISALFLQLIADRLIKINPLVCIDSKGNRGWSAKALPSAMINYEAANDEMLINWQGADDYLLYETSLTIKRSKAK